ncbi:GumC family protein [Phycisphaerales bacterium AB-hyl4]|uniref:GumC family protein n=1 Tax=Natronomicrosphaera hydrolytica TaxID=3242702 RepID=A0ABV4U7E2_9BACT
MNDQYPVEEHHNLPAPRSYDPGMVHDDHEEEEVSPLQRLHQLLRGRYLWAVGLAVVGAAIGASVAWFSIEPVYESTGMVHIRPAQDRLIYETELNQPLSNFGGFVGTQAALMQHTRVLRNAIDDPGWRQFGRGTDEEAVQDFRRNLNIMQPRGNEFITVRYRDPDREASKVAVRSVLQAYQRIHVERDRTSRRQTMTALEERRQHLNNEISRVSRRIQSIAQEYGSDALEQMYQFQLSQVQRLEGTLQQAQMSLSHLRAQQENGDGEGLADMNALTLEEAAAYDDRIASLLAEREAIEERLKLLRRNFGEQHREVRAWGDRLEVTTDSLEQRLQAFRTGGVIPGEMGGGGGGIAGVGGVAGGNNAPAQRLSQLQRQVERLEEMHADAHEEMLALGRRRLEIDQLKAERQRLSDRLQEARFRYETLEVESAMAGRIDVMADENDIDTSLRPVNARNRVQMTGAGLAGGGAFGFALILGIGLIDRRVRNIDDATRSIGHLPLLGVLPELPDDLTDPEHASLVAHSVHHIRTLMQLSDKSRRTPVMMRDQRGQLHTIEMSYDRPNGSVYTISSPAAGSGKTSLSIALGMSFANAGNRTLLIDADLTSGGLTKRMRTLIRRRIGQILLQQGLVDREQLDEGLHAAEVTGRRLGEALIAQGVVTEEQLTQALAFQEHSAMGLLDAMQGDTLADCVDETGTENLAILPIGGATVADLKRLSPKALNRVIDEARRYFEIILVDTGPVPGSMESSSVAAMADAVVFVVSRGDQRPHVERSVTFLESIGASLAGVVFNRADPDDSINNYSVMSDRGSAENSNGKAASASANGAANGHHRYGPVVDALTAGGQEKPRTKDRPS